MKILYTNQIGIELMKADKHFFAWQKYYSQAFTHVHISKHQKNIAIKVNEEDIFSRNLGNYLVHKAELDTEKPKEYYSYYCSNCLTAMDKPKDSQCQLCESTDIRLIYYTIQDEQDKMVDCHQTAKDLINLANTLHEDPDINFYDLPLWRTVEELDIAGYEVWEQEWD
ncbi:hypothetical protein NDK25_24410 [Niallia taxi]|nr:hypothetical protein [Niallia taxi]MDE5055365.1 hypothetical protein [Niallia taxi]